MKSYYYEGLTDQGTPIQGTVEAENRALALEAARRHCAKLELLHPMYAQQIQRLLYMDMGTLLSGGRIPDKKLALLCTRLTIQLQSGFPLVRALRLTAKTEPDRNLSAALDRVAEDVHSGESLAQSLRRRIPGLPELFTETVRSGELSGTLDTAFSRLREHFEAASGLNRQLSSALVYPAMLLATAAAVILVILIYAVPVFQESFSDMGQELPEPTRILIAISAFLTGHFPQLIAGFAALLLALAVALRTPMGTRIWHSIQLKLPGFGKIIEFRAAARFAALLSTLLGAGLPLAQAACVAADAEPNLRLREDLTRAAGRISQGSTLSSGLRGKRRVPLLLTEMIALGEETGSLAQSARVAVGYFNAEAENRVKKLMTLLEPTITLVLAALVIFILLCVYLPIFGMYGSL